jgi:hypothetical protein
MTSIEHETGRSISVVDVAAVFEKLVIGRMADLRVAEAPEPASA